MRYGKEWATRPAANEHGARTEEVILAEDECIKEVSYFVAYFRHIVV
jgi:hypothetical protein